MFRCHRLDRFPLDRRSANAKSWDRRADGVVGFRYGELAPFRYLGDCDGKKTGLRLCQPCPVSLVRYEWHLNESVHDILEQFLATAFHRLEFLGFQGNFFQRR